MDNFDQQRFFLLTKCGENEQAKGYITNHLLEKNELFKHYGSNSHSDQHISKVAISDLEKFVNEHIKAYFYENNQYHITLKQTFPLSIIIKPRNNQELSLKESEVELILNILINKKANVFVDDFEEYPFPFKNNIPPFFNIVSNDNKSCTVQMHSKKETADNYLLVNSSLNMLAICSLDGKNNTIFIHDQLTNKKTIIKINIENTLIPKAIYFDNIKERTYSLDNLIVISSLNDELNYKNQYCIDIYSFDVNYRKTYSKGEKNFISHKRVIIENKNHLCPINIVLIDNSLILYTASQKIVIDLNLFLANDYPEIKKAMSPGIDLFDIIYYFDSQPHDQSFCADSFNDHPLSNKKQSIERVSTKNTPWNEHSKNKIVRMIYRNAYKKQNNDLSESDSESTPPDIKNNVIDKIENQKTNNSIDTLCPKDSSAKLNPQANVEQINNNAKKSENKKSSNQFIIIYKLLKSTFKNGYFYIFVCACIMLYYNTYFSSMFLLK
ncbi:hypothetical protein EKK58_04040 [Candidatus Dependentiae bacterium]|nr:MAG: hypothetical protein EKK58_04040 [Candidatus Dependentiae bacterium]